MTELHAKQAAAAYSKAEPRLQVTIIPGIAYHDWSVLLRTPAGERLELTRYAPSRIDAVLSLLGPMEVIR